MNFNPKTATREDIKELQRLLIERGYNLGMY
jgi:hypothetical protein